MEPRTVLLIDGDADSLNIYSMILEHHRFRVLRASESEEGFRLACEHKPELIIVDPYTRAHDGRNAVVLLRGDERTTHLPVLVLTSVPGHHDGMEPNEEFLTKPCQPRELLIEIQRRLGPPPDAS